MLITMTDTIVAAGGSDTVIIHSVSAGLGLRTAKREDWEVSGHGPPSQLLHFHLGLATCDCQL